MSMTREQQQVLEERYGDEDRPAGILWNETVQALINHRTVRCFLPDALPTGALETMVAAAQAASNSSNLHQWSVVAVSDAELKARIAAATRKDGSHGNPYIEQAPVLLLWVADLGRNNAITVEEAGSAIVHEYMDSLIMSTVDTALAAQNAAVAAESLGLGVCFLGALRNDAQAVATLVGLPAFSYVAFGMAVGVPDPAVRTRVRPRPAQDVVLHHNAYDLARAMRGLERYEAPFKAFREELGMESKTWKDAVLASATDMAYMAGREDMRATLEGAGFKLR